MSANGTNWSDYVGVPFQSKGRNETGCDCWGLVCLIYRRELGIALPEYADLYRDANETLSVCKGFESHTEDHFEQVPALLNRDLDCVVVRMRGLPMHVGVYCGKVDGRPSMIHTTQARGHSHIEPIFDPMKPARHPTFWRHKSRSEAA